MMKKVVRLPKLEKTMSLTNNVLDMSVTIGLLGTDVIKLDIEKLECLLCEHCMISVVALERGDTKNRLHI